MLGENEGGNERYTKNLLQYLISIADVGVILYNRRFCCSYPQRFLLPKNDLFRLSIIPIIMKLWKYNVLHANYILPFFKFPSTKYVVTVHDLSFKRFPNLFGFKDKLLFYILFPYSLWLSDKIIVPSNFIRDEFKLFYPQYNDKIHVVYEGVDPVFRSIPLSSKNIDDFFLIIASKSSRKNVDIVIETFLSLKLSKIKLIIVGNKSISNKNSNIQYVGYISDNKLSNLYNKALGLIYYSSYEGFGLPIIEALALNTPVIASDIPCHREIGKDYLHYIKFNDINYLKKTIQKVAQQKKRAHTRDVILKLYNWDITATKTLEVYNSLFLSSL